MDVKAYSDMIHNIVVPATLSQVEMLRCYQPLTDFLQTETPERLYRFRQCNEKSIAAFDQDQLWVSPGYRMNDDFDALLHFNKESIKSDLKAFIEDKQFILNFQAIGKGAEAPVHIQNILSPEMIEAVCSVIAQMDETCINTLMSQLYDFFVNQIDEKNVAAQQIIQKRLNLPAFQKQLNRQLCGAIMRILAVDLLYLMTSVMVAIQCVICVKPAISVLLIKFAL